MPSLAAVEPFYDSFFGALGLARKTHSLVDADGEWGDVPQDAVPNVAEYYELARAPDAPRFVGIIEDVRMRPTATRVAFRLAGRAELDEWRERLVTLGARCIEWSNDLEAYPAVFFEDPCGTRLELCARVARPPTA